MLVAKDHAATKVKEFIRKNKQSKNSNHKYTTKVSTVAPTLDLLSGQSFRRKGLGLEKEQVTPSTTVGLKIQNNLKKNLVDRAKRKEADEKQSSLSEEGSEDESKTKLVKRRKRANILMLTTNPSSGRETSVPLFKNVESLSNANEQGDKISLPSEHFTGKLNENISNLRGFSAEQSGGKYFQKKRFVTAVKVLCALKQSVSKASQDKVSPEEFEKGQKKNGSKNQHILEIKPEACWNTKPANKRYINFMAVNLKYCEDCLI